MLWCPYCHYVEETHKISVTKVMEGSKCHFFQIKNAEQLFINEGVPQNIALLFSFRKYGCDYIYLFRL